MNWFKRNWKKLLLIFLLTPPLLILLVAGLLYTPAVQQWAVNLASKEASKATGLQVSVEKIRLRFPLDLSLQGVHALEISGDTLASVGDLQLRVALPPLLHKNVEVPLVILSDAYLNYQDSAKLSLIKVRAKQISATDLAVNLQEQVAKLGDWKLSQAHVVYSSVDTSKSDSSKSDIPWRLQLNKLEIDRVSADISMPFDSLYTQANIRKGVLRNADIDLAKSAYKVALLDLEQSEAAYQQDNLPKSQGLDYKHIYAKNISLGIEDFSYANNELALLIKRGSLEESSGAAIRSLHAAYRMDSLGMQLDELLLQINNSSLQGSADIPFALLKMDTAAVMALDMQASIGLADLDYFEEAKRYLPSRRQIRYPNTPIEFAARAQGSLNSMQLDEMSLFWEGVADLDAKGNFYHLLDNRKRAGQFNLNAGFQQDASGLLAFAGGDLHKRYAIPAGATVSAALNIKRGSYQGKVVISERSGKAELNGDYQMGRDNYYVDLDVDGLDLQAFMPHDSIGPLNLRLHAEGKGFDPFKETAHADLSAQILQLRYGPTQVDSITLDAALHEGHLYTSINSFDPKLNASVQLDAMLGPNKLDGDVLLQVDSMDLVALGLSETRFSSTFLLEGKLSSDLNLNHQLSASTRKARIRLERYRVMPENIDINLLSDSSHIEMALVSGDLKLAANVEENIRSIADVGSRIGEKLSHVMGDSIDQTRLEDLIPLLPKAELSFTAARYNPVHDYLQLRGMAIRKLDLKLQTDQLNGIRGNLNLDGFQKDTLRIDRLLVDLHTSQPESASLFTTVRHDSLSTPLGRMLAVDIKLDKERFRRQAAMYGRANLLLNFQEAVLQLAVNDAKGKEAYGAGLRADWNSEGYGLKFLDKGINIAYNPFSVNPDNRIFYYKNVGQIKGQLKLSGKEESQIYFATVDSIADEQELILRVRGIKLENFVRFTPLPNVAGLLYADLSYWHNLKNNAQSTITGDLSVNGLYYDAKSVGDIATVLFYEPRNNNSHYVTAQVNYNGDLALNLDGIYHSGSKDNDKLDAQAELISFPLAMANPFIGAQNGRLAGVAEGALKVTGRMSAPLLDGQLQLKEANVFAPQVGNTFYLSDKPLLFKGNKLIFDNYDIRASKLADKAFDIDGSIILTGMRATYTDLKLRADKLQLMDTKRSDAQMLYGKLIASSDLRLKGLMKRLSIRGSIDVHGGTDCTYVYDSNQLDSRDEMSDVVVFTDFTDTLLTNTQKIIDRESMYLGGMDILVKIHVDPAVALGIDLSSGHQDYVRLLGGGDLSFSYPPFGNMSLTGRYEMSGGGKMRYNIPVVGAQNFDIVNTSFVSWSGKIEEPYINFKAKQRIRANVPEPGTNQSRKVNFDVGVIVKESLDNMDLAFDLEAVDDLGIQAQIAGMSAEERAKQAVGLMATGSYLAGGSAGGLNFESALSDYAQGMINSALGKVLEGSDFNIGMESHDGSSGRGVYTDVTYSFGKRFYNDRIAVRVGGSVATGANAPSNQERSLIDNMSVEYRLDQAGAHYVRLFHNRNNQHLLEGEITETGVGYIIRRKLNRLGDLFRFKLLKATAVEPKEEEALEPDEQPTAQPDESTKKSSEGR